MTIKEKLKLMAEIDKRNTERLVQAGLKRAAGQE